MKRKWRFLVYFFIASIIFLLFESEGCVSSEKVDLVFADASSVWWTAPTIFAKDFFEKNNVKVQTFDVLSGLASKNAVVSGTADIGLVASTPLALGAYDKEPVKILCSYVESKFLIAMIKRRSKDSHTLNNQTIYEPVAIVPSTISEWYFYNYLKKYVPQKSVSDFNAVHVSPADILNVLEKGDANTAVIWEPFVMIVSSDPQYFIFKDPELYTLRLYLITRPDVLDKKKKAIDAFVSSLEDACSYISTETEEALKEIAQFYNYDKEQLRSVWKEVDFSVRYDFDRMRELILLDAKCAVAIDRTKQKFLPDLDHLFNRK